MDQFLDPETGEKLQFLDQETDILCQFLFWIQKLTLWASGTLWPQPGCAPTQSQLVVVIID